MSRPDQSITFLKDRGYCVLRTPRADTRPLQTLLRAEKKDLTRLGELATISVAGTNPLPALSIDNDAPIEISGKESSDTKIEVGVSILGSIVKALGGNTLGISAAYTKAKAVTFKFEHVLEDHIDVDRLDQYLSTCSFRTDGHTVVDALIDDAVYVITSTLKTDKFTVNAKGDSGTKVGLDVPVINQIASGSLKVDTTHANEGIVSYEGRTPVVFGFQAVQIFADEVHGRPAFTIVNPVEAGSVAAREVRRREPTMLTLDQGAFFRMDGDATREVGGRP
jgi:hypothetical protein